MDTKLHITEQLGLPQSREELKGILGIMYAEGGQAMLTNLIKGGKPDFSKLENDADAASEKILTMTIDIKAKITQGISVADDVYKVHAMFDEDITKVVEGLGGMASDRDILRTNDENQINK